MGGGLACCVTMAAALRGTAGGRRASVLWQAMGEGLLLLPLQAPARGARVLVEAATCPGHNDG